MAQSIASWSGTVTPDTNMVEVFRQQELELNPNSYLKHTNMIIRKIAIKANEGAKVKINGREIELFTGVFETGFNQVYITSLEFDSAIDIKVYYLF